MTNIELHNPHLEGDPFLWEAGQTAVLLVHGLTATTTEVRRLGRSLRQAGFTVAGPLLPGHRATPAALNRTRWQDWYGAVETAYTELARRCARVFVGGESTGALLALLLAARHPEAAGVLAYAPALQLRMSRWQRLALPLLALFVPSLPKHDLAGDKTWQGYPVNPLKAIYQLTRLQSVVRRALPGVTQPLLVIQGRQDTTIDQRSAELVYQGARSEVKELHWLEDSDHCLLLDKEVHRATLLTLNFLYR
jgi:carboxylesterase